jgi:hypothetical protein
MINDTEFRIFLTLLLERQFPWLKDGDMEVNGADTVDQLTSLYMTMQIQPVGDK